MFDDIVVAGRRKKNALSYQAMFLHTGLHWTSQALYANYCLKQKYLHKSVQTEQFKMCVRKTHLAVLQSLFKNGTIWGSVTSKETATSQRESSLFFVSGVFCAGVASTSLLYKLVQRERVSGIKAEQIEKISRTHTHMHAMQREKHSNESLWMSDPNKSIIALGAVKSCVHPLARATHFPVCVISPRSSQ